MIWLSALLFFFQAAAPNPQIERGRTLFLADGKCGTCHALKGKGTAVGPDLKSSAASESALSLPLSAPRAPSMSKPSR